ncbi:hypothetical protein ES702_01516 [subsurface metagenome]
MKKIIVGLAIGSLVAASVGWYAIGGYARGAAGQRTSRYSQPGNGWGYMQMLETKAEILGATARELGEELEKGKCFSEIAQEKGFTLEEFQQRMLTAQKEHLQKQVDAGLLTKVELNFRLQLMEERHEYCEENPGEMSARFRTGRDNWKAGNRMGRGMRFAR